SQQAHAHRRALDVPPRTSWSPGTVPLRLARLGGFPEGEVTGIALAFAYLDAGPGFQLFGVAVAELAVIGIAADVKIDVAVRRIGKPLIDQFLNHPDDVGNILGRTRHVINARYPQTLEIGAIIGRYAFRQLRHRGVLLVCLSDEFIVHVRDVDHERDLVAE